MQKHKFTPLYVLCVMWAVENKISLPDEIFVASDGFLFPGTEGFTKEFLEIYTRWIEEVFFPKGK